MYQNTISLNKKLHGKFSYFLSFLFSFHNDSVLKIILKIAMWYNEVILSYFSTFYHELTCQESFVFSSKKFNWKKRPTPELKFQYFYVFNDYLFFTYWMIFHCWLYALKFNFLALLGTREKWKGYDYYLLFFKPKYLFNSLLSI